MFCKTVLILIKIYTLKAMLVKFHWLGLMVSIILSILIIILTLGNFSEIPVAAHYVLKVFIDVSLICKLSAKFVNSIG